MPRSLLEQKQIQKEKEEELLEQVQVAMKDGKIKIKERFEELAKELNEGLEREKKLVEGHYVSSYNSTEGEINFLSSLQDEFCDLAIRENKEAIQTLQFAPLMLTLHSVQVQPGQIQWPQLQLPDIDDLHLGSAEEGQDVDQEEGEKQEQVVEQVEGEPLDESLRPQIVDAYSSDSSQEHAASKDEEEEEETVKVPVVEILSARHVITQEESVQNFNNNPRPVKVKTLEKLPGSKLRLRPMLSPVLPASGLFRAKIVHIDSQGVLWLIPNDHIKLRVQVATETSSCTAVCAEDQVDIGKLLVCKVDRTLVRGRICEVKEGGVVFLNIDSGEPGQCRLQEVFAITQKLLSIPPLAIPVKLYGMKKKTRNQLDLTRILEIIPRAQVTVSLVEPSLMSSFPLPANIRYPGGAEGELESNLALTMLDCGLLGVVTSHADWTRELHLSGLDWLNLPANLPLTSLPHPLPLAPGLWLSVTVQGIYFPLDEEEPAIQCPNANRVSCHLLPLSCHLRFNVYQRDIAASARVSKYPLESLEEAFEDLREKLADDAEQGGALKEVKPGDGVLVRTNEEWCRATVLRHTSNKVVQISYTDYGHDGYAKIKELRSLKERRLEPVQVREFLFEMPESNKVRTGIFIGKLLQSSISS